MINDINNLSTLKEIEQNLFQELQNVYQNILISLLEELDIWLRDHRDFDRFENREIQACTIATMFGSVTIKRRRYLDRKTGERVALLDQYLQFSGSDALSPFLNEVAVQWAVKGPSYRDARDRFIDFLGYQAMSHETIRQKVLKIEPKADDKAENPKDIDVLFLEVDGLHVHKQNSDRSTREAKIGVVHEGWEKKHPGSEEYELRNKSYWRTLGTGEEFWESFSRYLYSKYSISEDTYIVINGDGAPWIREGVNYFESAIYTYDRYHLKKWIKGALSNRSKQERREAYLAADANDPTALLVAIAEAEKAEIDVEKKKDITDLRLFILENMNAFRDYREILKNEKGINTELFRPMGAAESNMNLFSRRLKKMGCSWSFEGLGSMLNALIHLFEGTLIEAIQNVLSKDNNTKKESKKYPSFASLLTERTRQSIGAIQGHIPALVGDDQRKPYTKALRDLAGF